MNNEIQLMVSDIPEGDLETFLKRTNASATVKEEIKKVTVDFAWVDKIEEAIPYLDNIIRNPRRFIVAEEDIVPIEKTKRITEESIKHLATHTSLIQAVDNDGTVKPIKLLNVFKEETIDLYENRFIFSLINNLYAFVRNQLTYTEQEEENKEEKTVIYEGNTYYNSKDISISLAMKAKNHDEKKETTVQKEIIAEKIEHIKEVLEDFKASKFMLAMANATPVRSPIRKTNVILKEQNFMTALSLWEFLENYQVEKPVKIENVDRNITSDELVKDFSLTYFLNYCVLTGEASTEGLKVGSVSNNIAKIVEEYAKKFSVDEIKLKEELNQIITNISKYKKEQINNIDNTYRSFITNHKSKMDKAVILFE